MINRQQRRAGRALEHKGLKGDWGLWRITSLPDGIPGGTGWCKQVREARANNLYVVLIRPFADEQGNEVIHLAIRTASQLEPPWREMQRIKNEICGEEATAVQVMPPASELVDEADMYHMWVLSCRLPFTLAKRAA
ncbi:hypothetical protein NAC44_20870 [Allorhizobium sp. BGMRC 0089]|uniref:DUF7694 domain-containing protein n=1 Tax=Allorhizobium sonneratiae TaxID=2934936 RepID=UPI00203489FB|nr:hypothetical protein [Allorhizobium sonneratiae]MCM2294783.1 hypothetical protein [Allorhizobium sonneratiae]